MAPKIVYDLKEEKELGTWKVERKRNRLLSLPEIKLTR